MAISVIVHLPGEPSIVCEIDELPKSNDTIIIINNPRLRDGKDVHYLEANVTKVIWSLTKVAFIEILENAEEEALIGFVRE
jgi:hypothetical protein